MVNKLYIKRVEIFSFPFKRPIPVVYIYIVWYTAENLCVLRPDFIIGHVQKQPVFIYLMKNATCSPRLKLRKVIKQKSDVYWLSTGAWVPNKINDFQLRQLLYNNKRQMQFIWTLQFTHIITPQMRYILYDGVVLPNLYNLFDVFSWRKM